MRVLNKNGLKYVDEGKGGVILFFHGWGLSPYAYKRIISELSLQYRIIAPFIDSFKNFKDTQKGITSLINKEDIKKVIIIGHSAGGIVALKLSSDLADRIRALILVDSVGAIQNGSVLQWRTNWIKHGLSIIIRPSRFSIVLIKDFLLQMFNPGKLLREGEFVLNEKLQMKPKFPVLILWGERDDLIPIQNGYNLQKSIKNSKFISVKGGHYWFLDRPELFSKEVERFIN